MTMTETTYTSTEVLKILGGKITYRQLDSWTRTGQIRLAHPYNGPGSRRRFTTAEVIALIDLVDRYTALQQQLDEIRSGAIFEQLMRQAS